MFFAEPCARATARAEQIFSRKLCVLAEKHFRATLSTGRLLTSERLFTYTINKPNGPYKNNLNKYDLPTIHQIYSTRTVRH